MGRIGMVALEFWFVHSSILVIKLARLRPNIGVGHDDHSSLGHDAAGSLNKPRRMSQEEFRHRVKLGLNDFLLSNFAQAARSATLSTAGRGESIGWLLCEYS